MLHNTQTLLFTYNKLHIMPLNISQIEQLELSIRDFVDDLYEDYVSTLSKLVKTSFDEGIHNAEKNMKSKITFKRKQDIYNTIPETLDYVEERITPAFDTIYNTLTDLLEQCIRDKLNLNDTKDILTDKIRYLEKHIPFDSVGQIVETSEIIDGLIIPAKKTITKKHTMKTDDYFGYVSRDVAKMAYLQSKLNGYKLKGYSRFKYVSKNDSRTRPEHKKLHNRVFDIGSYDASLALKEMMKPNCRCDMIPKK